MGLTTVTKVPRLPRRALDAHKGSVGRVLVIGGSRGMAGAPCLAARGACRAGAGLVLAAVPRSIWDVVATKLDECLTRGFSETRAGTFARAALQPLRADVEWADVVVLGPGMSGNARTAALCRALASAVDKPLALDADGLNAFAGKVAALRAARRAPTVLTPHPGEMARLLGWQTSAVQAARGRAVAECSAASGAVVVLKGAGTLVCDGRRIYCNTTGNPGMATGGAGDVLSGILAALMGQGLEPFDAAVLGVYLHGLAGDLAARRLGVWSLTAGDVVNELPRAFKKQAEGCRL